MPKFKVTIWKTEYYRVVEHIDAHDKNEAEIIMINRASTDDMDWLFVDSGIEIDEAEEINETA